MKTRAVKNHRTSPALCVLVTVLGAGGCGSDPVGRTPSPTAHTAAPKDVNGFVLGLGELEVANAVPKTEVGCDDQVCPADSQEGKLLCTYTRYAETAQYDKFVALQPNSATLWPGSIVRGADAQAGVLTPVGVPLAPVTFSISLENIGGSPVGKMDHPSLSEFRSERNKILAADVTGATPASIDFDVQEVYGESQLSVALGASVSWPGGGEVAGSFEFSSTEKKTKILVDFTQSYYTIDVDTPAQPEDFFAPDVTVDDLAPFMDDESPPVYVQSITYGRRVIFSVETTETADNIKAALQATYAGAVDVSASVSLEHKKMLEESTIRAFVIGGSGVDATGAINGFEGLVQYIENGGDYSKDSPGAPIAYKLAYLDNAVTRLAFTTEYTERTCLKNRATIRAELLELNHVGGDDLGGNVELFGDVTLRHSTAKSGVTDCGKGGVGTPIWTLEEGSWISFPKFTAWTPTSPVTVTIEDVPIGEGEKICLSTQIYESDQDELSGVDDFGNDARLVSFDEGWAGEHVLQPRGTKEQGIDVKVKITVE